MSMLESTFRSLPWFSCFLALLLSPEALAQSKTRIQLRLDHTEIAAGGVVLADFELKSEDPWHTYWRYPGEDGVGSPTKIDWTLPAGVTAGAIEWPLPQKHQDKIYFTHIFSGETHLVVPLRIDPGMASGVIDIKARLRWLECETECVPGNTNVAATLRVGSQSTRSPDASGIEANRAATPQKFTGSMPQLFWDGSSEKLAEGGEKRPLVIAWVPPATSTAIDFFPYENTSFRVGVKTDLLEASGTSRRIRKWVFKEDGEWPASLTGVIAAYAADGKPLSGGGELTANIGEASPAASTPAATAPISFATLLIQLASAFIGGLVLNIMPCVLPVLALKILGFVSQAKQSPKRVRKLGLVYGLGVLVSFLILSGLAIGIQAAGGIAGWSTPFQSPIFRVLITTLLLLVSLNLFGVFEVILASRATETAAFVASRHGVSGAFFNGVLAAVLATPCTAPFLASAMAFAFSQPPWIIVLFFLTVGLGLAAPFVALCWQPAWLKHLPKPGDWMVAFKQAMGFPMLATTVWLFWPTAPRLGENGVLWFGLFLVLVAAAAWVWGEFAQRKMERPRLAMAISCAIFLLGYLGILEHQLKWRTPAALKKPKIAWQKWSPAAVSAAKSEGRPALVDFTAQTCVNCKWNKSRAIEVPDTIALLRETKTVALEADFTDEDPEIAAELRARGRSGVPLVLVYPAKSNQPPRVLPVILNQKIVQEALVWAAKN